MKKNLRRFVLCDNCGKKIYEGSKCVVENGLIYICCSHSCLAHIRLNCVTKTMDNEMLESQGLEWEEEIC